MPKWAFGICTEDVQWIYKTSLTRISLNNIHKMSNCKTNRKPLVLLSYYNVWKWIKCTNPIHCMYLLSSWLKSNDYCTLLRWISISKTGQNPKQMDCYCITTKLNMEVNTSTPCPTCLQSSIKSSIKFNIIFLIFIQ